MVGVLVIVLVVLVVLLVVNVLVVHSCFSSCCSFVGVHLWVLVCWFSCVGIHVLVVGVGVRGLVFVFWLLVFMCWCSCVGVHVLVFVC